MTRMGMLIRAGASNRRMAGALGVDIKKLFTLVFALGAAMAGLAGSGVGILGMVFSMAASTGISLLNDGTPLPMVSAIGLCGLLSFLAFRLLVRPLGRHGIASKDPAS